MLGRDQLLRRGRRRASAGLRLDGASSTARMASHPLSTAVKKARKVRVSTERRAMRAEEDIVAVAGTAARTRAAPA